MSKFKPFANERDTQQIGNLSIENRLDRVSLNGDVDLTCDQAGLAAARELKSLLDAIVSALEEKKLPEKLPPPVIKPSIIRSDWGTPQTLAQRPAVKQAITTKPKP